MFFLLRSAFWLSLLLLVLPLGLGSADGPSAEDRASIDTMAALAAAGATVSDVGSFCSRQPDACAVGSEALKLVGERAKNGAAAIQDYLASDAATPAPRATPAAAVDPAPGRDTLTPADRKPAWRAGRPV